MKLPKAKDLVGRMVKHEHAAAAISCCMNGAVVKGQGKVTAVRHNPTLYFGRNTLVVRPWDDAKFGSVYVRLGEVTAIRDRKRDRWREVS